MSAELNICAEIVRLREAVEKLDQRIKLAQRIECLGNSVAPAATAQEKVVWRIQQIVASHFGKPISIMVGRRGPASQVWTRHVAIYFSRELTRLSMDEIAELFGAHDHGSVVHAIRHVRNGMETHQAWREEIEAIRAKL
jgi:chromosomal replication initiator protein